MFAVPGQNYPRPMGDLIRDLTDDEARKALVLKWGMADPDQIPAWVAEMDFAIAEPIQAALHEAIIAEFVENEDMPSAAHPEDWARVSGLPGGGRRRVEAIVPLQGRTPTAATPEEVTA